MKFFTFNQNNSGGSFDFDAEAGISHFVIIEADSADSANARAEQIGLYFDGCNDGIDCDCCGDRWHSVGETDGEPEPMIYGRPALSADHFIHWMKPRSEMFIHYADGRIVGEESA